MDDLTEIVKSLDKHQEAILNKVETIAQTQVHLVQQIAAMQSQMISLQLESRQMLERLNSPTYKLSFKQKVIVAVVLAVLLLI